MELKHTSHIQKVFNLQRSLGELKFPSTDEDYKIIEDWKNSALSLIETTLGRNQVSEQLADRIRPLFTEPPPIGFGNHLECALEKERKNVFETSIAEAKSILSDCIQHLTAR